MDIYNRLFERLTLLPEHKKELMEKRGFTEETIQKSGFKSARPENKKIITDLQQEFGEEYLKENGILDDKGNPSKMLTVPNTLIPFYDGNDISYFRAHKYGMKGRVPPLYHPRGMTIKNYLILAESEFKAAALYQLGFPVIGLQGISMYSKEHFEDLQKFIEQRKVEKVCLLWDNEDKASKTSKYFKDDPKKRYDVEYYAYITCYQLGNIESVNDCRIATLPSRWRIDGGIDIDKALAAGHTKSEFTEVLKNSKSLQEYRKSWSKECQKICQKKLDRFFFRSPVYIENNCYYAYRNKHTTQISNFHLKIEHNYLQENDEYDRGIVIVAKSGSTIGPLSIGPDIFSSPQKFKDWVGRKGDFWFTGNQGDLDQINKRMVEFNEGKIIHTPSISGWYEKGNGYLFNNCFIRDSEIYPVKDGAAWCEDEGFKAKAFDENKSVSEVGLYLGEFDYQEAFKKISENWSGYAHLLSIGWVIANVFADMVIDKYGKFPILMIGGMKESGKTSLCETLCALCGREANTSNAEEATRVGVSREMDYYSNLPVHIDEYRPTSASNKKYESYLRSSYDRQGSVKGLRFNSKQVRRVIVNATLMISGEASPTDSALLTRCVNIIMDRIHLKGNQWSWICANKHKFSAMYRDLAVKRNELGPKFMEMLEFYIKALNEEFKLSQRHALNYGICLSALEVVAPNLVDNPEEFMRWVTTYAQQKQTEADDEHVVSMLLYDLAYLQGDGKMKDDAFKIHRDSEGKYCVYMHPKDCFNIWSKYMKDTGRKIPEGFGPSTISSYLRSGKWRCVSQRKQDGGSRKWYKCEIIEAYGDIDVISTLTTGNEHQEIILELFRSRQKDNGAEEAAEEETH